MTRAEQLRWWQLGYQAGIQARHDRELALHQAAAAEFRARRIDDQQAELGALLLEVVDVLARALLQPASDQDAA